MPAYKNILATLCVNCRVAKAVYEVFNARNASVGKMCSRCADWKIRQLDRLED